MADSAEKFAQAELRLAKAQEALGDVVRVLTAAEEAQAAADRALEAAYHAHKALRRLNVIVPVVAVVLGVVTLLARSRHELAATADLGAYARASACDGGVSSPSSAEHPTPPEGEDGS